MGNKSLRVLALIIFLFLFSTPKSTSAANLTCTWTGAGGNALWSNPANWSTCGDPATYPGANNSATINSGTVDVDINITNLTSLTITSGTVSGIGNIGVDTFNWSGGTMGGTGTTTVGTALNLSGTLTLNAHSM